MRELTTRAKSTITDAIWPAAAGDSRELSLARAVRVFPGAFPAGYALAKAWCSFGGAVLVAITRHVPGRGLERQPPRVAPEVLVVAGLGLIGPVIWISQEAV